MTRDNQASALPTTRRGLLAGVGGIAAAVGLVGSASAVNAQALAPRPTSITVRDGTTIFYKD